MPSRLDTRDAIYDLFAHKKNNELRDDEPKPQDQNDCQAFLDLACERLLEGKCQWDETQYPDIREQIEAIISARQEEMN
jgi:hypothetical protein